MKTILQPGCSVAVCWSIGAGLCAGQTKPADPSTQELLDQVHALRAQVEQLQAKIAASQPESAAATTERVDRETVNQVLRDAAARQPLADIGGLTAGHSPDIGFIIRSEDGNFLLHPWAFVQIRNATTYRENETPSSGDTQNGFELPRMKFILDGN